MKTYRLILPAVTAAILSALAGCSDENDDGRTRPGNLTVYSYINSGCANKSIMPESPLVDRLQEPRHEIIRLTAVENNRLQIEHKNIMFNCAAKLEIEASIENSVICITGRDTSGSTVNCLCPYSLSYEIPLSGYGEYTLKINESEPVRFTYSDRTDTAIILNRVETE
jgi:hypothetical protein